MKFELLPLRLAYSEEPPPFENIKLMSHQAEMLSCQNKLITITAPTGGGKTLAFLLRIMQAEKSAIIVLPTNELIEDQSQSICALLRSMGKTVYTPSANAINEKPFGENQDYAVIIATGSRLEEMAGVKTKSKGTTLAELLSVRAKNILLITNPDTLHLLFRGKYYRAAEIFQDLLKFKILVIDEFHLYYGTTLANLIFILGALREHIDQLIVATATPSDILLYLKEIFKEVKDIVAEESSKGYTARQRMQLEVLPLPQNHILTDEKDVEIVAELIGQLYRRNRCSGAPIKTLAIVNSIAFCIKLTKRLREEFGQNTVSAIHSLIPAKDRESFRRCEIVIGTSALEVGIDFDVGSILVEANNAPAFMQRLGRAARRREAEGIAMIPAEGMLYLTEHADSVQLDYSDLKNLIYSSLNTPLTYSEFLQSKEAAFLYDGFLYGVMTLAKEREQLNPNTLVNLVKDPFWRLPFINVRELEDEAKYPRIRKLKSIALAGFRGYLNNLPVFLKSFNRVIRVGFFELPMLPVTNVLTREEFERELNTSTKEIKENEHVIVVEDFADVPFKFRARWGAESFRDVEFITKDNASIDVGNPGYSSLFFRLIEDLPAYSTSQRPDWRLPSIRHENEAKWLIIGLDAYLQKYLDSCQD